MSLRKSPRITPELLAANRRNARRSTGPRTAAGKSNSKFNALKHGGYASLGNHYRAMLALGENLEAFERFKQELTAALGPGDARSATRIEYLAKLYWRRERRERAERTRARHAVAPIKGPLLRREMAGAGAAA